MPTPRRPKHLPCLGHDEHRRSAGSVRATHSFASAVRPTASLITRPAVIKRDQRNPGSDARTRLRSCCASGALVVWMVSRPIRSSECRLCGSWHVGARMPSIMVRNRVNLGHRRSQRGRQRDSYRLEVIDQRTRQIEELSVRIEVVMEPFQSFCTLIHTITGIGQRCAEVVVAGTGSDMNVFPTAAHLASWAGTCPGGN